MVIAKDLAKAGSAESLYKEVKKRKKKIAVLVNNAGFGLGGHFMDTDLKTEQEMMHLNIVTLTELSKYFVKDMKEGDKILNVASVAAFMPGPGMSVYFATKAYVLSFSQALSAELKNKGITVTALCPGTTRTRFFKRAGMGNATLKGPLAMDADIVAKMGYEGMKKGKSVVVAGFLNWFATCLIKFVPKPILFKFLENMNGTR